MGLSASQARLLTITARKSDCEYESMRLSHQKIALSRDMNKISAEYDNAMAQTKLIYDYYGKDSESTDLTYGLLMTPSAINNYTPAPITDSSGRVVLDSRLAKAARDAGIPQEGLDGLPSSDVRNKFIDSLASTGYISQFQADNIKKTTYNQMAGVGSADLVNVSTEEVTLQGLIDAVSGEYYDFSDVLGFNNQFVDDVKLEAQANGTASPAEKNKLSFADILNGNYMLLAETHDGDNGETSYNNLTVDGGVADVLCNMTVWDSMFEVFENLLDTGDPKTQAALAYARRMVTDMMTNLGAGEDDGTKGDYGSHSGVGTVGTGSGDYSWDGKNIHDNWGDWREYRDKYDSKVNGWARDDASADTIGLNGIYNHDDNGKSDDDSCMSVATVNVSNMFKAYLTYFAQYMEGLDSSSYEVTNKASTSNLIDEMFTFTIVTDVDTSGDNLLIAAFWDTLFNQICTKGWTENDNVNNQDYLQESLKNGNMYISTLSDDGYYYQGNYATNSLIKEVTDEEGIAQAEARYNREKQKINYKENILDMKMKNLDTEISSLTTEYDTVKSVISKNIEKVFKRYNA
ncbi:hypothetical protein DBY21_03285 [Candidatus Gastranaerophilales bacterium]|nr:MAG: hypothetical protein DBY21_03285 [Candidatus Gastranaerophilales bacterium]